MLGYIASLLVYFENKSCLSQTAVGLFFLSEVKSVVILGTFNGLGKCNDELKLLKHNGKF